VNADEIRYVRFLSGAGYDATQVDELLRRIAVELDAARPIGPLIANATFRPGRPGYEIDAVDWFLEQLLHRDDSHQSGRMGADPWQHLAVANHFTRSGPDVLAEGGAMPSRQARSKQASQDRSYLAGDCADVWRDFGQQPGTQLRWVRAGAVRRELRTAEQQPIASLRYGRHATVSAGGRTFTWKRVTRSSWPRIAEIADRSDRDYGAGHFLDPEARRSRKRQATGNSPTLSLAARQSLRLRELLDETGTAILYASGKNFDHRAGACITFPDQRWLRFPVRSTREANAIMTAVDQAGNKVARYRMIGTIPRISSLIPGLWKAIEITAHPGQQLTDELVLALVISAPWLASYFDQPGGGG
jgi:DivIVA domain-containing protein